MRPTRLFLVAVLIVAGFAIACDPSANDGSSVPHDDRSAFRSDVIHCAAAAARLAQCCPDFQADGLSCEHHDVAPAAGCDPDPDGYDTSTQTDPALDLAESECILHTSCEEMTAGTICARAAVAVPYVDTRYYARGGLHSDPPSGDNVTHPQVCP